MKKELKSGILSADKSADGRRTVGGVNVIADLVIPIFDSHGCARISRPYQIL